MVLYPLTNVSCLPIPELVLNCFYTELSHTYVHYNIKLPNRGLSRNVVSVSWLKLPYTKNVSIGSIGILVFTVSTRNYPIHMYTII